MTRSARRRWGVVLGLALVTGLTACAAPAAEPAAPRSTTPPTVGPTTPEPTSGPQLLVAAATVLDAGRGPQLCVGAVAASLPPQCGGPPIDGWTWPEHGTQRVGSVTWGEFFVVGTYEDGRFAFDRLVTKEQAARSIPGSPDPDFATPCPEPPGGWRAPDPGRATGEDQQRVVALAETLPGYADLWIDDRGDPAQDPLTTVVNVQVTGDLAEAERRLRSVWGGPLCVSSASHSRRELDRVRDQLADAPGLLSSSTGRGVLDLLLVHDDGTLQRRYDARFGAGLVHVGSALRPYLG